MSNEVTIDELRIEIEAESGTAAGNIDKLAQSLDRLQAVTQRMTGGGDGLNKVAKQIEKLNAISQNIRSMRGFERLGKVVNQLAKLDRLSNVGDISGLVRNLNKLPQAVNAIAQMPSIDATKFQQIADALKPLNDLGTNNINSFLRTLGKFPQTAQQLAGVDLTQFEQQIRRISTSLEPLTRQAERGGAGLTALAQIMQSTSRQARQSSDGVGLFNQTLGQIKVKTLAAVAVLRRLFNELKKGVTASAAYVENLNLFSVTMGDSAGEALKFAEAVNDALGVDVSDWIRYQGVFQSIGKGFGIVSSQADVMSKNLTQLSYDISSFYNITADTAAEKLQSAMSGQVMPMRQLGFAIEETTLKQVALNHGITQSVENMTQAQKAQLRYIAIMEQAGSIGVLGDMARTIDTAANGMRVFTARLQQFARAVGNMVMPVLSAVLPYATAFVQVITEGAQKIAEFFGFELPKIDFSGASVSSGFDDITSSVDDATKANEKFKGSLSSIDQLNIIGSKDDGKNSAGNENQFDLGIELPEYDFLQGVESKTKEIVDDIKAIMPWVEALAAALGTVFIAKKVYNLIDALPKLGKVAQTVGGMLTGEFGKAGKIFSGIVGGLAAGASSGILLNNSIKNLITGTGKLGNNIAMLVGGFGIAGVAIAAFIKLGNPVGAVITGIGAAIGTVSGICKGLQENADRAAEAIMSNELYNNGGTRIDEIADAFGRLADKGIEINQEFVNKYDAVHQYDTQMQELSETIQEIAGLDLNLDDITPANAEKLKAPFDELCGYLKTTFETEVQTVADDVARIFTDLNLSDTIGAEMQAAYRQMKIQMSDELSESQKTVDQYLERIQSGEQLSNADMAAFKNNFAYVTEKSLTGNESYQNLQRAFDELDLSKIDELSSEEVQEKLNTISDKYNEYLKSWQDRYDTEINSINNLKSDLDSRLKYGLIDTDTYNARMDLLTNSGNLFAEYASQQVKDMSKKAASITDQIIDQSIFASELVKPKGYQKYQAFLGGMDAQKYASAQALMKNPVYNLAQELNSKFLSTSVDVAVNTTFATEGGAETWKILTKELNPNIDAEIGRIQDTTGNLKYIVGTEQALIDAQVEAIKSKTEGWKILTGEKTAQIKAELVNSPFTAEYKAFLSKDSLTPTHTDMGEVYKKIQQTNASLGGSSYRLPAFAGTIGGTIGAAREAVSGAAQGAVQGSAIAAEFVIHNYNDINVDGETLAECVSESQQRQMVYSNGR